MRRASAALDGRGSMRVAAAALLVLWLSAAPALGQDGDKVQYGAVCQNIIGQIGDITQSQTGGATASGTTTAIAAVAQYSGLSIAQVNECLNGAARTPGGKTTGVIHVTIPDQKVLADTGGPAVLLPALGLLLVAGGATMIRTLLRR